MQLPFDPEILYVLLKYSPSLWNRASFLAQRQSALVCCLFWGNAYFDKIVSLNIRHLLKKGHNFELHITARRFEVYTFSRRVIVKPVSSWGQNCPVKILKDYLDARLVLTPASGNYWLFPGMNINLFPNKHTTFSPSINSSQCQFDIYHRLLRTQFDIPEMIARGVSLDRTDPYVERQGRECMLGVNVVLSPACMRRNQPHKYRYSEWRYTDPTTEALTVVTGMELDPQRDLQQRHKKRKQLMRQFVDR